VILSQASQIKSDYSFALIKATADNKSLVQDASSAELKVNALVEYSKDSQWDPKKLISLGFPAGCFLIVDLRGQDIHAADLITNLALVRQYGYQAGVIDDLSTLDDIKTLKTNQIYLINSGKINDNQDASLNGDEITDDSGKLAIGMSVKWQRDYTNVDVSGDHAGFVGMGQDTLLKGGNAFGYSTNGRDFNAVITPKGLIFRRPDAERMWRLLKPNEIADINSTVGDKVKKEVDSATAEIPAAVSAANSAVSAAESAVAASKVNSDAIVAQSEAISEAKSAMDSATAEIQQTAANAASDAAKIRADVARVQNEVDTAKAANSASVEALKSDVNAAKQDLAYVHDSLTKAQSAIEQNQKLINDSVAKINADITQDRKDIASAQQANANTAKQLDTYSKQAATQGKTIKSIQDKQDSFTATLADVQGNVSQVSDKVDGLSASLKDTQGNVATVKAQADQLNATLTDHAKSIATLTASAKELSSTLEDADGRLNKVEQTAQTNSSTLSDVQGNLSQVKQQADGLVTTLKDAQGSITQIQQKADGTLAQLKSAQGDIASLQTDVTGIKATLVSHEGDIHTLQADSKSLHDSIQNAQGDISTLKKTSTDVVSELKDHAGRISKTEQTASTLVNEFADQQGHLNRVEQTAQGTQQTVADQQGQINNIKTNAAGIHETLTGQGNQIANINATLGGLSTKYEGVSGDLGKLKNSAMQNRGTVSAPDFNSLTAAGFYTITVPSGGKNYPTGSWGTLEVSGQTSDSNGQLNQKYVSDNNAETYVRQYNAHTKSWTAWIKAANQNDVTALSNRITTNSTQITQNKQAIALKADQTTVNNLYGEVNQNKAQLKVQADQISSKVSSEDFKTLDNKVGGAIAQIGKNTTAIDQTNRQISLKADQTEVDQVKQTASQNGSRLDIMDNEIKSKVTSTDVNNIVDKKGYATTSTVQSLITQKAGTINESITNLTSKVNSNGGGINLLTNTQFFDYNWTWDQIGHSFTNGVLTLSDTNNGNSRMFQGVAGGSTTGRTFSLSFNAKISDDCDSQLVQVKAGPYDAPKFVNITSQDFQPYKVENWQWTGQSGTFNFYVAGGKIDITNLKLEYGAVATPYSLAPSDEATVTQVQEITASIDGLQSTVANKADKSQITQLSNMIQSKVSSSDFNDLKDKTLWKSTDSIDLNTAVSQQKIFVKGGPNLPPGGYWWYVRVEPGYASRIAQYATSDRDNKQYHRQYDGVNWSAWTQDASESEITQLRDDINLRVKSGDLLSQINIQAGRTLIQSQKIYMDADSVIMGPNTRAFIPSAAIINLDVAKLNAGTINTDRIHIGDDSVYLSVKNNYLRLDGSNTKDKYQLRLTGNDIEFADNDSSNWEYRIQHGITQYQTDEDGLDFDVYSKRGGANHTVMAVSDAGVMISPSLFFQTDGIDSSNWMGFTRNTTDGNTAVSFHTWNDENEGFHVDCGARFLNYVYINGYARAQGWLTNSTLSKKTNIRKLDNQIALDKIRQDDQYLYEYNRNVAKGIYDPQASFIIDDVNDVAQYSVPREFIDQTGKYREPNVELAYLVAAFQALDKQVQEQNETIKKLEAKLNE
jgi:predicted  nucleic acid-binding Zn-ribbon protein